MDNASQHRMDKVGIFLSLSCCLHCLVTPFLLVLAPAISDYFQSEWIHILLFLFVAPVALFSFLKTHKESSHKRPLILGSIGLFGLFIGLLIHTFNHEGVTHESIHVFEVSVNILSGLLLIAAHFFNFKDSECKHC